MARLIDAERFECISFQATGEQRYDDGFADGVMFISERIDSAPTIDAIPLEWLNNKMLRPHTTNGNPFGFVLAEWLEEQEAR